METRAARVRVFVYGTLMRAGANHGVLVRLGGSFVACASTEEPRTLVDLGPYPALLAPSPDDRSPVAGELWELPDAALADLDAFEGCPDLYRRERLVVVCDPIAGDEPRAIDAFVYVLAARVPRRARVIASGRYEVPGTALPTGAAPEQIGASLERGERRKRG